MAAPGSLSAGGPLRPAAAAAAAAAAAVLLLAAVLCGAVTSAGPWPTTAATTPAAVRVPAARAPPLPPGGRLRSSRLAAAPAPPVAWAAHRGPALQSPGQASSGGWPSGGWVAALGAAVAAAAAMVLVRLRPVAHRASSYLAMAATSGEEGGWSVGHVSAAEPGYRVMAKAEIPGVLPRADLMDQLLKWAVVQFQDGGRSNFGVSMTIAPQPMTDGVVLSFLIAIPQPDGLPPLEVQACLDDETFIVQRQLDGFGKEVAEVEENGKASFTVQGRHFLLRRREGPLADTMRPLLLSVLQGLCQSVNNYYAFGSVFASDAT